MYFLYNIFLNLATDIVAYLSSHHDSWLYEKMGRKVRLFIDGQSEARQVHVDGLRNGKPTYWFHAASLGEYGIARPVIMEMRKQCDCNIVLTFFSSTGVEALKGKTKEQTGGDIVTYLPLDSQKNVKAFLDAVRPEKAIFIKSEYWLNYLHELHRRNISTYLVSAYLKKTSVFFRWYGGLYRKVLGYYTKIYTQDEESAALLSTAGYNDGIIMGDPLYDNAITNAETSYHNDVVERFCATAPEGVFIAGSIDNNCDLDLISALVKNHPEGKFIIVPHEVSKGDIMKVTAALNGKSILYSECNSDTSLEKVQSLVINYVGDLAKLYRYGKMTYVGGGFTPLLHSVIEPSVYGLPVAFGPKINRKAAPQLMMKHGIGFMVRKEKELDDFYTSLYNDSSALADISRKAKEFVIASSGKTEKVVRSLLGR